jgi:hypothetical protein
MKIAVSCVTESRPAWLDRAETLALSLRAFGGRLTDAPLVVNVVGGIETGRQRRLEQLGVTVRVVAQVDARNAFANKLRMLELTDELEFDLLLALDCDIAIAAEPALAERLDAIGAKPADVDPLSARQWRRLFAALELDPPDKPVLATTSGRPMAPYFNSGVLLVPATLCADLRRRWTDAHARLAALLERDRFLIPPPAHFYRDQFALAAALQSLPWHALPVALNFPTHLPVAATALADSPPPALLHYHGELDRDGFLLRPRCARASAAVERVNRQRAGVLGLSYDTAHARPRRERLRQAVGQRLWRTASSRRIYHAAAVRRLRRALRAPAARA